MKFSDTASSPPHVRIHAGYQIIRDYTIKYDEVETSFIEPVRFIFPPTGHLILNLFYGDDFTCRFLNYNRSPGKPNQLYITGLLSWGPLMTAQQGTGGGYAMKIHPVIGYHFLRIPMHEITDRQVRISYIFNKESLPLRNSEANTILRTINHRVIKKFFQKFLPDKSVYLRDPIYHAVNKIVSRKGIIHVKELATEFCMSERTLRRQFLEKVGLPPQAYAKIWQILSALELLRNNPGCLLSDIAFKSGYYDVAHLAHDFRSRLFVQPSKFYRDINPMIQSYLDFPESMK